MTRKSLAPNDWILAGFAALANGGIEAVRVEPLSRQLETSKGSFYWHFADRAALLGAMLDMWEAQGTVDVINALESSGVPAEKLRTLIRLALEPSEQGLDVARTEAALRSWAAEDADVAPRVLKVDQQRTAYLARLLVQLGHDNEAATTLATGLYMTLLGLYSVRRYAPELADDQSLLALLEQAIAAASAP
ncbi:TetR/AcrR family transcriptional regulator [Devosia sp. CAU 1758]